MDYKGVPDCTHQLFEQMPMYSCYWQGCCNTILSTEQTNKVHGIARQRQEQERGDYR